MLRGGNAIETYPSAPPVPSLGPWTCLAHSNIIEKQELLLALENKHGIRLVEKSASIGEADLVLSSTTAALLVDAHDLTQRRERSRGPLLDASFRGDLQPFGAGVLDMIVKAAQQYQQVAVLIDLRGKAPVVQQFV